jgi:hypothetical protein
VLWQLAHYREYQNVAEVEAVCTLLSSLVGLQHLQYTGDCTGKTIRTVGQVKIQTSASDFWGELINQTCARIPKKYPKHVNIQRSYDM